MNTRQLLLLFKLEITNFLLLTALVYIAVVTYIEFPSLADTKYMFSLNTSNEGPFIVMSLFFAYQALFLGTQPARVTISNWGMGGLEFFFTRAIDRSSWFLIKVSLFIALVFTPATTAYVYSHFQPIIKIELPYNSSEDRNATKQFYLSNFEGAYLQEADTDKNEDYVVLPNGHKSLAVYSFALDIMTLLIFQIIVFLVWPRGWGVAIGIATCLALNMINVPSMKTPSRYEAGLAWVTQHTFLVFLSLGLLTVLAQFYCRWRFMNTEITS